MYQAICLQVESLEEGESKEALIRYLPGEPPLKIVYNFVDVIKELSDGTSIIRIEVEVS